MKKSLFATALLVALVGCSKSNSDRMGTSADREIGTSASSTADTTSIRQRSLTVTNDASGTSGSGSIESVNSGAAAGSLESTNNVPPPPTPDLSQPQQPQQPAADPTGDQSNGDTSNRPAGAPAQTQPDSGAGAQSQPQSPPSPNP